jgi:hypothetical protein
MNYAFFYYGYDDFSDSWAQDIEFFFNIRPVITGHKNDKIKTSELQNDRGFISLHPESNGHDYVEIGGIKWATMNVGATKVTDVGLYFQWGDT